MSSGWLINFKNGTQVILTERAYQRYEKETPVADVRSEEHWFNLEELREEHSDVDFIE